jgi:hypothetical protein
VRLAAQPANGRVESGRDDQPEAGTPSMPSLNKPG